MSTEYYVYIEGKIKGKLRNFNLIKKTIDGVSNIHPTLFSNSSFNNAYNELRQIGNKCKDIFELSEELVAEHQFYNMDNDDIINNALIVNFNAFLNICPMINQYVNNAYVKTDDLNSYLNGGLDYLEPIEDVDKIVDINNRKDITFHHWDNYTDSAYWFKIIKQRVYENIGDEIDSIDDLHLTILALSHHRVVF